MAEKDNFLIEWYKRLKFEVNPFEDEIIHPIDDYLCGYVEEKKKLNLFVLEKQPFGMVQGEKGFGKTILLKWLQEQLAPHNKKYVVWYLKTNDLKTEQDLIKTLTEPVLTGLSKLTHPERQLTLAGTKNELAEAILIGQKDTLKINLKGLTVEHAAQFIQKLIERAGGL